MSFADPDAYDSIVHDLRVVRQELDEAIGHLRQAMAYVISSEARRHPGLQCHDGCTCWMCEARRWLEERGK